MIETAGGDVSADIYGVKLDMLHADIGEIKTALNELSKAITKLALVEQQQTQIAGSLERAFSAIGKLDDKLSGQLMSQDARLATLEKAQPRHTEVAKWVDRGLVALAGAGAVLIGKSVGIG